MPPIGYPKTGHWSSLNGRCNTATCNVDWPDGKRNFEACANKALEGGFGGFNWNLKDGTCTTCTNSAHIRNDIEMDPDNVCFDKIT